MNLKKNWSNILLCVCLIGMLLGGSPLIVQADSNLHAMIPKSAAVNGTQAIGDILVSPESGTTTETGGTFVFNISLGSPPTDTVTIDLYSSNTGEGTVSPSSVVLDNTNYSDGVDVTVTGVNDAIAADVGYTIVTDPAVSNDTDYNGNPADVAMTNLNVDDTAGYAITNATGLTTTEGSGTATFDVALTSEPSSATTVSVSSNDTTEGKVTTPAGGQLSFDSTNWSDPQPVTVTGQDDFIIDGDQPYTVSVGPASGAAEYQSLSDSSVSLTNTDNDTAGIIVSPTSELTTDENGGTATFNIHLTSAPSSDVTIGLISSNTSEGTVPSSVTLNSSNWQAGVTVTVTGVADHTIDGNIGYTIVTGAASSTDGNYGGLNPADVSVTNDNTDSANIIVSPTSGLVTTEAGGTASFNIKLASIPSADVTVGLSSDDTTEGTVPSQAVLNSTNWSTGVDVTVTGQDDFVADGDVVYHIVTANSTSGDTNYVGINPPDVTVTNQDDDTAGYTITPTTGLVTSENGTTATFTIRLNSQPTSNVTVSFASSKTTEGTVSPASVTFTPEAGSVSWDTPQIITLTGVDDTPAVADGNQPYTIVTTVSSTDTTYNSLDPADVSATNQDNDVAGYVFTNATSLTTSKSGTSVTFHVALATQPTVDTIVAVTSTNTAEGTITAPVSGLLTFTATNWATAQDITVKGVDDLIADGDITYPIHIGPATGAPEYVSVSTASVNVTNQDNDAAGYVITNATGLTTSEAGGTATFDVALSSQPSVDTTVNVTSQNLDEGTISIPADGKLTFTTANWATPQPVTITGVDDFYADGTVSYSVKIGPASGATEYASILSNTTVDVNNTDNDTAGYVITEASGLSTTEGGGTATFKVALSSQPTTAPLTVNISSSDTTEGTVTIPTNGHLTFTADNWNTPQTVTIKGADDTLNDGTVAYSINVGTASGASEYASVPVSHVSINNLDNEIFWVNPVGNRGSMLVTTGSITLQATPSNSVDMADFDHIVYAIYDPTLPGPVENQFVEIGTASTAPYTVNLPVDRLVIGGYTQVYVFTVDKEGHRSPYNPQNGINLLRPSAYVFIPIVHK